MEDIGKSAIGSLLILVLAYSFNWLRSRYSLSIIRHAPRLPSLFLNVILLAWAVSGVFLHYFIIVQDKPPLWLLPVFGVWSLVIIFYLWQQRSQLRSVGIKGADRQTKQGIDYQKSLRLCQNELKFLGIGAAKLTSEAEFEKAIRRCRKDNPIRFLLCKPTHEILVEAAKRFDKDREAYQKIVRNSLQKIATLKEKYSNIEVRFYSDSQILRLLFIDDSLCLFSYNVMGEGDGSQSPQLHVIKPLQTESVVNSFYYPLEVYYDTLWNSSEKWDFKDYLQ